MCLVSESDAGVGLFDGILVIDIVGHHQRLFW